MAREAPISSNLCLEIFDGVATASSDDQHGWNVADDVDIVSEAFDMSGLYSPFLYLKSQLRYSPNHCPPSAPEGQQMYVETGVAFSGPQHAFDLPYPAFYEDGQIIGEANAGYDVYVNETRIAGVSAFGNGNVFLCPV